MGTFDLEVRTLIFSKDVLDLCQKLPKNQINYKIADQLIRSATSVGANYREANETATGKDFKNRIRIAKKEAKETIYWLQLLLGNNLDLKSEIDRLIDESWQLVKILAAIYSR